MNVVAEYNLTTVPPSVLKCGAALPAAMSAEYCWKASAGDVVGATPVAIVSVNVALVPHPGLFPIATFPALFIRNLSVGEIEPAADVATTKTPGIAVELTVPSENIPM